MTKITFINKLEAKNRGGKPPSEKGCFWLGFGDGEIINRFFRPRTLSAQV